MNELDLRSSRPAPRAGVAVHMTTHVDQCRCACGAMLARIVSEGLELKCRKCKAIVIITHDELAGMYRAFEQERRVGASAG